MTEQQWTIDSIAHALPEPALRQQFLAEVNLAPLAAVPGVLDRWVSTVTEWQAAERRLDHIVDHIARHGEPPAGHQPTDAAADATDDFLQQLSASSREGRAA
ncbi:hypothetical protein [Streptomyces jumonjinensis]|uniref:Uncharacterized protein n=1 Tax=Streptomyces jumonjinensis TaxID=1945 RepID=A0A646KLM1_STRJU|nr:hypothetical protein [Streptomyces jumonjinensis]MQT03143.1 hypothetical protein [Streptomyces jumonjinensis]